MYKLLIFTLVSRNVLTLKNILDTTQFSSRLITFLLLIRLPFLLKYSKIERIKVLEHNNKSIDKKRLCNTKKLICRYSKFFLIFTIDDMYLLMILF